MHRENSEAKISIHAPSRERLNFRQATVSDWLFQSTLPRGSDMRRFISHMIINNFNPHSLAGATTSPRATPSIPPYFNPHSLAGATTSPRATPSIPPYFNPHSLAGATAAHRLIMVLPPIFQSTLPRGSDLVLLWRYITPSVISIHAPLRERHPRQRQSK